MFSTLIAVHGVFITFVVKLVVETEEMAKTIEAMLKSREEHVDRIENELCYFNLT